MSEESIVESDSISIPHNTTILNACKIAIAEDRPIMLDYWTSSLEQKILIGKK